MSRDLAIRPEIGRPGRRLRVEHFDDYTFEVADETTRFKHVADPDAEIVETHATVILTDDDAQWLKVALAAMTADLSAACFDFDIEHASNDSLIAYHLLMTARRDAERHPVIHQAYVLRCGELERALAIRNARAVHAMDEQAAKVDR